MVTATLPSLVLARLEHDAKPNDAWPPLVMAALEGESALVELLATTKAKPQPKPQAAAEQPATKARPTYLRNIAVQGFRGIGPEATLELAPGPGLTLVIGRNGSGKSSFAEALEMLLTGDTFRWAQRTKVWREGWRNLHHQPTVLRAEFALEGERGPCVVTSQWDEDAELDEPATSAQIHGKPRTTLSALGWGEALATYRPFLSYNELGSMLDEGPSKLYDALAAILGLDALVDTQALLQQARTSREKALKDAGAMRDKILAALAPMADERAQAVVTALQEWGLGEIEKVLAGSAAEAGEESALRLLRELAALTAPKPETLANLASGLRTAGQHLREASGTVAARSQDLAELLDHALRFHESHGDGDCPVCGRKGALDAAWHKGKAREAKELRDAAREVDEAQKQLAAARSDAQRLPVPRADLLEKAGALGLAADALRESLRAWTSGLAATEADELAAHVERTGPPLAKAVEELRRAAADQLQKKEDDWRPLAAQLNAWVPVARSALQAAEAIGPLKKAEGWLKDTAETIRDERFGPIAERSIRIWEQLRLHSNVSLGRITLEGSGKRRHVELHVQVDGVDGAALGVMSQGELHCLALSLFIPRATLPESPFRFIVIDDPVQSMDPARVDGLARVLEAAAKDRQVVVFTHDDRLPEAARRLGLDARTIEVTRRESSLVQLRPGKDPVARNIEDAMAVAKTDSLPAAAAKRVIPGLCRLALEAACAEAVRRRRLARGERHGEVEELLANSHGTKSYVSLALFDDPHKAGDVLPRLDKESRDFADVYRMCNEGAHGVEVGFRIDFIRQAEKLARWLQARP
jgi:energy-coupling factor transporter ATP-binding protein EcfA2